MSVSEPPRRPSPQRGRAVALVAIALLVVVVVLVGQAIVRHNALQNCIDSGRRDCETRLQSP